MTRALSRTLVAVAIVLGVVAPSHARGHGHSGGHHGHRHHGGAKHHGHGFRGRHFGGSAYPYWWAYPYLDRPLVYWYCASVRAYYPDIQSCPGSWVPVPTE